MNNLWTLLGITIFVVVVSIGFVIYAFVTKTDYYILKSLFIIGLAIFFTITDIPYMEDVIEQETTTITAEYHHFQPSNTRPGTRTLFFESQNGELRLLATTPLILSTFWAKTSRIAACAKRFAFPCFRKLWKLARATLMPSPRTTERP